MMDKSEIIISFRSAKDKERQIKVLSDLNCVSPREIADILDEAGELKKAGLNAKTFSSVYRAVPAAKAPQREGPKATRKRSGSVPPLNEIRAMELFNDGMDDVAISEALGVSVTRIRKWRSRMRLLHPRGGAAKNKKAEQGGTHEKDRVTKKWWGAKEGFAERHSGSESSCCGRPDRKYFTTARESAGRFAGVETADSKRISRASRKDA